MLEYLGGRVRVRVEAFANANIMCTLPYLGVYVTSFFVDERALVKQVPDRSVKGCFSLECYHFWRQIIKE